ncbi:outer membrane beta-barrel protein [uncultured Psychroserpens sp.]|uniref:outer membrane beta-barrel protein n=1 Tax=uncultured Psychroserpens sp. TaxID=255436 RepID=UPI0026258E91|nr:outer membrane beta-barrel protein [uncultured Psychroserpens sp.]
MKTKTIFSKPLTYIMLTIIATCFSCAVPLHRSNMTVSPPGDGASLGDWAQFSAGASLGYGSDSSDDDTVSAFCAGAEFMYNIIGGDEGALYGGLYGSYHTTSADDWDESIIRGGVRARYYDHILPSRRLQAVYGVDIFTETGDREIGMFKDDITGFGGSAVVGLNYNFNENLSLRVDAPVFTTLSRTLEFEGGEVDVDKTWFGINKDNVVALALLFSF